MRKILRLASYPTVEESGRGLHCYEISNQKDYEVIYLTWFRKDAIPFGLPANTKLVIRKFYTQENPKHGSFLNKLIFNINRLYRIVTFSLSAIYLMIKHRVDVVHIHSPMFIFVSFFSNIFGKVNIITFHGADFFRIENAKWYKFLSYNFDLVFSISPRYIDKLRNIHNCEVVQIFNGIDNDIYKNNNKERKKQIVAVANFKPQKGLKYLVDGFNRFINKYNDNDYQLVIVGRGILFNEIKNQINKLNIEDRVLLVGQKNRKKLIEIYNESEVFILSSIWEGFAKVLLESMSCGCKVISTNVDSAPLLLEDWGYMINHSSSSEICESIYKIINDSNYQFEKQLKSIRRYNWEHIRIRYNNTLYKLL
jgi:glycosyltransferase involved in cell wall biosynthesis